jgi:AraC family transcriptional regulator
MEPMTLAELGEPQILDLPTLLVAGTSGEYTQQTTSEIPKQWDAINETLDKLERFPVATYGVVYRDSPMRYVSGLESSKLAKMPEGWEEVKVPAQRYAIFGRDGGVEAIRSMWTGIWMNWIPANAGKLDDGPMVEFYPERFGMGHDRFEIWLPLKNWIL